MAVGNGTDMDYELRKSLFKFAMRAYGLIRATDTDGMREIVDDEAREVAAILRGEAPRAMEWQDEPDFGTWRLV